MWFLAETETSWIAPIVTALVSVVGGGGLATIITTYLNNQKGEKADSAKYLAERVTELEVRDKSCNERVTALEKKNGELEREAFKLRDRLLQIESQLITAVVSADSNMRVISWNEGATLMFGYLASDMLGQDVDILVPGYLKQKHHDAYEKAINDMDGITNWVNSRPAVGVHKDGHEFNIELLITSFKNSGGSKFFEARISKPRAI